MKTLEEALDIAQASIDRRTVEDYIARQWLRPAQEENGWAFADIDIARLQLVCHLTQDIKVNEEGMDVILSLLDQLYGLRTHMKHLTHAISRQPEQVRSEIVAIVTQLTTP